jgi:hypothetical protein
LRAVADSEVRCSLQHVLSVTCESAAAFSACLTFWIPCTWLFQVSNISSTLPACASCCRVLLSLTITHQLTFVFLALSFFWRRCATRTCILCFICSSEKFTAYPRYFLENFKFLLSYPGRGAFYVFCGSLALANTGEPARCFLLLLWMKLTLCFLNYVQENRSRSFSAAHSFATHCRSIDFQRSRRYVTGGILCTNGIGNFVASYK